MPHTLWLVAAAIFAFIGYFIIKPVNIGFWEAMSYATSAGLIALMGYLSIAEKEDVNVLAMLVGAIAASFPVVVGTGGFSAEMATYIEIIALFGVFILNSQDGFGGRKSAAGVLVAVPMLMWVFWGLIYLHDNGGFAGTAALPLQSWIYHIGIIGFASHSALRWLSLLPDNEKHAKYATYLLIALIVGALLSVQVIPQTLSF